MKHEIHWNISSTYEVVRSGRSLVLQRLHSWWLYITRSLRLLFSPYFCSINTFFLLNELRWYLLPSAHSGRRVLCMLRPSARRFVHPVRVTTLQPTLFHGSCSYLAQPLTLVWAWTLLIMGFIFLAVTKKLHEWFRPSIYPSVTPFSLCSHHRVIMNFSRVVTNDKRSEVKGQGHSGQNPSLSFPDRKSSLNKHMMMKWCTQLMLLRRGALLFFKVIRQISRWHG